MTIRHWLETASKVLEGFGNSKNVRCAICHGAKMHPSGKLNGLTVYRCAQGHTRVPGLDVGDPDDLIEKTKGDFHGDL